MQFKTRFSFALCAVALVLGSTQARSATIFWTDWLSGAQSTATGYTAQGQITTSTTTLSVTYNNPIGVAFAQFSGGIDYYTSGGVRNVVGSPYTSAAVDNIPTGTDIIALQNAGQQTLTFSAPIANPVFAYVSLNGNGYGFNQDFEILSFGDASNGNGCGYWGCGTSNKQVVGAEYRLLGTGEPHGVIRFLGTFSSVSWRSLSNENWNGFTLGVQGTAAEIFPDPTPNPVPVPVPATLALVALGLLAALRKKA
jgi:PEP-CTERM motif